MLDAQFVISHSVSMKLDQYLAERNLTSPAFGDMVGIDASTIWRIKEGKRKPEWNTMEKILVGTDGLVTPNDYLSDSLKRKTK